jgi:hypothetical protein
VVSGRQAERTSVGNPAISHKELTTVTSVQDGLLPADKGAPVAGVDHVAVTVIDGHECYRDGERRVAAGAGVQVPSVCQPLLLPCMSLTHISISFSPTKPLPAVSDRFKVSVDPDPTTVVPLPFSVHWLFDKVCPEPGVRGPS